MPQMAPIMWDLVMTVSFLILLMMISKIYFSFKQVLYSKTNNFNSIKVNKINWLW